MCLPGKGENGTTRSLGTELSLHCMALGDVTACEIAGQISCEVLPATCSSQALAKPCVRGRRTCKVCVAVSQQLSSVCQGSDSETRGSWRDVLGGELQLPVCVPRQRVRPG